MRDWCSECQFANYGGSQEPCYNCVTTYNKKPSEFTPASDEVRGVGKWEVWEDYYGSNVYKCSVCGADWDMIDGTPEDNDMNYCPHCGARMTEVSDDA